MACPPLQQAGLTLQTRRLVGRVASRCGILFVAHEGTLGGILEDVLAVPLRLQKVGALAFDARSRRAGTPVEIYPLSLKLLLDSSLLQWLDHFEGELDRPLVKVGE